jgi:hypothetical protein
MLPLSTMLTSTEPELLGPTTVPSIFWACAPVNVTWVKFASGLNVEGEISFTIHSAVARQSAGKLVSAPVVAVVGFEFALETVTEPLVGLVAVTVNVIKSPALAV